MAKKRFPCLRGLLCDSTGFTLVEVLVAVGILTLAVGMVGGGVFQSGSVSGSWRSGAIAVKEWRDAQSWFSADALNAETTDLVNGSPLVDAVTLTWTDRDGVPHIVTYSLSGSDLIREYDGVETPVARRAVSVGFSLSGSVLTFDLEVEAGGGATESTSLQTYLRMLR